MSDKYTYADVIIDPEDPRVEIGKEYYFGNNPILVIRYAKQDSKISNHDGVLREVQGDSDLPFVDDVGFLFPCIIRKKEPENKYVPFDLGDPEVRENLRGKWAVADGDEGQISGFHRFNGEEWMAAITTGYVTAEGLLDKWKFVDGSPCGRLVEA